MKKIEKLKRVSYVYIIPLIFGVMFPFMKTVEINGGYLNGFWLFALGFLIGMAIEGALLIASFTFALLFTNELD